MKKGISILLSLLLAFSICASAFGANFSDVTNVYSWAEDAISELSEKSIVEGYTDGTFKPGNSVSKQEAIALFARALGASDETNASVVQQAVDLYGDQLAQYNSFAVESAAYLIYKKVLTADEMITYLADANKAEPLKRYEAATLISKSLGGDAWLRENQNFTVTFADAEEIPSSARGYVYHAAGLGIIMGMEDNLFVPNGDVTRAQMCVMIKRILDLMQFTYVTGMIASVDANMNTLTLNFEDGTTDSYIINSNIAIMKDGQPIQITLLEIGMEAVVTFRNNGQNLYSIDIVPLLTDEEIEGVYRGRTTTSSGTTVQISPVGGAASDAVTYPLAEGATVQYGGGAGSLSDFKTGDYVLASIVNGEIVSISGTGRTTEITGAVVESISLDPDVRIYIRTTDNEVTGYALASSATIRKNGASATYSDLAIGDTVDVTLEYGLISGVVAYGAEKDIEGTLEEITISRDTSSAIKIKNGNTIEEYTIGRDAEIIVDGVSATMYDLRLGYQVEVTTSSSTVTRIEVQSVTAPLQITGRISLVNAAYGMIRLEVTQSDGNVEEQQIFIKSNARIIDSQDGKTKTVRDLAVGQTVTVVGAENIGIFEATTIMIISSSTQ